MLSTSPKGKLLIGTLGTTPAVFTEILADERDITDVIILHTKDKRVKGGAKLLKVVIPKLFENIKYVELIELDTEDIYSDEDVEKFIGELNKILNKYHSIPKKFLISGGRKSQSALLYFLSMIHQGEKVLHIAYKKPISTFNEQMKKYLEDFSEMNLKEIEKEYENNKDFFKSALLENDVNVVELPIFPIVPQYIGVILNIIQNPRIESNKLKLSKEHILEHLINTRFLMKIKNNEYKPTEKAKKIMRLFK